MDAPLKESDSRDLWSLAATFVRSYLFLDMIDMQCVALESMQVNALDLSTFVTS